MFEGRRKEKKRRGRKDEEGRELGENTNEEKREKEGQKIICTEEKEEEMNTGVKGNGKGRRNKARMLKKGC